MNARKQWQKQALAWVALAGLTLSVFVWLETQPHPPLLWPPSPGLGKTAKNDLDQSVTGDAMTDAPFLRRLPPLDVQVYANPRSQVGRLLASFLAPYQRLRLQGQSALRIQFVDPASNPARVRMNQVDVNGEILLRLRDAGPDGPLVHLQALDKELFLNAWWRLARISQEKPPPWILLGQGFGSRDIDDSSNNGIGRWVRALQKGGYRVTSLPLDRLADVASTQADAVVILPSPQAAVPPNLLAQVAAAASPRLRLLWLHEPELASVQSELELALGLMSVAENKGVPPAAMDKSGTTATDESATRLVGLADFEQNSLLDRMPAPVLMPGVLAFQPVDEGATPDTWQPLLGNGKGEKVIWRRPGQVVVGDSDFISNAYLNQGGNRVLAQRLLDDVLGQPHYIPAQASRSSQLVFTQSGLLTFSVLLLFGLPVLFVLMAIWRWRSYRRLMTR